MFIYIYIYAYVHMYGPMLYISILNVHTCVLGLSLQRKRIIKAYHNVYRGIIYMYVYIYIYIFINTRV